MSGFRKITAKIKLPVLLLMVIFIGFSTSAKAYSLSGTESSGVKALNGICSVNPVAKSGEIQIFSVAVKCFENLINGLAEDTIASFSDYLSDIVYTVLILYVIFYGARVALGFNQPDKFKSEFFVSAMKIGFVTWLVFSFGLIDIYMLVVDSYHSLISIVLSGADYGDCQATTAAASMLGSGTDAIWATMDCQFSKFIGWESKNGNGVAWTGVPLLFGYISSKFLPANGFIIGGLMFTVLWTLMMSFFRMAFVYILSMFALILLFSISPLMIPLILFQQTKTYFDGWYKLIISMILQPVILFAFFAFVARLITDTVTRMKQLFEDMKPAFEQSGLNRLGNYQEPQQVFDMVGSFASKIDPQMLMSGITTLVVAYLLMSFINFVSSMAKELSGFGTAPELAGMTPKFMG